MANENLQHLVVPFFRTEAIEDRFASKQAGRPIFKDMEVVEVRIAGDRNFAPVFPALSMWERVNDPMTAQKYNCSEGDELSYAERWPDQYARFKEGNIQVADGTPLDELTFLSNARRAELRALKIYTAEALAALEGKNLKVLGGDGYSFKQQAQAYLDKARGGADSYAAAAENAELRAQMETMKEEMRRLREEIVLHPQEVEREHLPPPLVEDMTDDQIKEAIALATGSRPRGNPARETLVNMLQNLS